MRTTSTLNEGYIGSVGAKVDMAVRKSSNPANRSIAITGVAQAQSGSNEGYWRTILFQQKTTGTPVEIFSGWPQDKNGHTTKNDFPEAVAVDSTNAVAVTGLAYDSNSGLIQNFRTIRYTSNGTEDWIYDWADGDAENKEASGTDIVLDRSGNVYATGYIQLDSVDYATIRIPWDWDEDPDNLEKGTWDHSETDDRASSIDLSYEVEGGVIKPYIYVTGKASGTYDNVGRSAIRTTRVATR